MSAQHTAEAERREQVRLQCRAVAHLAKVLSSVFADYERMFAAGALDGLIDHVGDRSAGIMETLGDILNDMDAVGEPEDAWISPVFEKAHQMWPQPHEAAPDLLAALKGLLRQVTWDGYAVSAAIAAVEKAEGRTP